MANRERLIEIPLWQLEEVENALRLAERTLGSADKKTSIDRDIMQSWQFVKNAIDGNTHKRVSRF